MATKVLEIPITPTAHQWTFDEVANPNCSECILHRTATVPCLTGIGPRDAIAAIYGEGPGLREDEIRRPFSGRAGKLLDEWLQEAKLNREELFIDNVTRCFPGDEDIKDSLVAACSEYTTQTWEKLPNLKYVLCLGAPSARQLAGVGGKITKKRGTVVERNGITYMVTLHPAFVLRQPQWRSQVASDIRRFAQMIRGEGYLQPNKVMIAETLERLNQVLKDMLASEFVSYDVETQGLRSWVAGHKIWSISLSNGEITWTIPLEHPQSRFIKQDEIAEVWDRLRDFFKKAIAKGIKLVAQNCAFDNRWLRERGIEVQTTFDTMMAAHLLDENTSIGLKTLASRLWGVPDYSLHVDNWEDPPERYQEMLYYNGCDSFYTARAYLIMREALRKRPKLAKLFTLLVMPGALVLSKFASRGSYIDGERVRKRRAENLERMTSLEKLMNDYAPGDTVVNWNSSPQVGKVLYDHLKLPVIESNPDTGHRSTRDGVLKQIKGKHPLPQMLLDYRKAQKRESTYLGPWEEFSKSDSRLHFDFKLDGTVTGRRSSRMHQIPRDPYMRSIIGAPPGKVVLEADYAQIELRVAAELSGEPTMLREFDEKVDPHLATAMEITGLLAEQIDSELRKKAKPVNFGYLFGMYPKKFQIYAREKYEVEFTLEECEDHRTSFFGHWPGLADWHERCKETVRKQGYVEYLDGRRRRLPGVRSSDRATRQEAERLSINSPVQGFAADLTLMAIVELEGYVEGGRAMDLDEIVSVAEGHDSIRFEVQADRAAYWEKYVKEVMEHPKLLDDFGIKLRVPIVAETRVATHWADPEKFVYDDPDFWGGG